MRPSLQRTGSCLTLSNGLISLGFDLAQGGALVSLQDPVTETELVRAPEAPRLLWHLGLREGDQPDLCRVTSDEPVDLQWQQVEQDERLTLLLQYSGVPGSDLSVQVAVTLEAGSPLSRWRTAVRSPGDGVAVCEIACPLLCGTVRLGDPAPGEALLAPVQGEAYLYRDPFPVRDHLPLRAGAGPETADVGVGGTGGTYPGQIAVQMMALYNDTAGVYFACHDAGEHPKRLTMAPDALCAAADVSPAGGLTPPVLAVTHLLTESPGGEVAIDYDTVVGLFHGDWYDAADLYRDWAHQQWWCERTLWERDIPDWLREGVGGVFQMSNYHIPRLDLNHSLGQIATTVNEVAKQAGVPLLGLVFNWEGGGAWTGPEGFFPPREGEAAFSAAMQELREAANHGFVYMTGNNWYVKIGYDPPWDSWPQFYEAGAPLALRRLDGEYTVMTWYGNWEVVRLCPAPPAAPPLHADILCRCLGLGCDVVQIDNFPCGGSEACYATDHGHPRGHGPWWSQACRRLLQEARWRARAIHHHCAITTEGIAENFIPYLDLYDQRAGNMEYFGHYHRGMPMHGETVPLFNYLYNDYIGSYYAAMPECNRPEVLYWTRGIGKAVCQGVLPAAGRYFPDPPESNPVTLGFFTRVARAVGRELYPYLMFGRMLRPPQVASPRITAQYCNFLYDPGGFRHEMDATQRHEVADDAVQRAAYEGPDGSVCVLTVNVSEEAVQTEFELPAYGHTGRVQVRRIVNSEVVETLEEVTLPRAASFELPPLSVALTIIR